MKKILGMLLVLALVASVSYGAAATAAVDTPKRAGIIQNFGVYTNTRIFAGTMVCLNSSGYAVPAADTSGYIVIGRASKTVDNRTGQAGAGDSGALTIDVERGVFGWTGRGISSDTAVGSVCYVSDDNSVTNGAGSNSIIAGTVVDYSDSKVWVDTFNLGRTVGSFTTITGSGAASLGSATITGAATVGTTLGVTGVATMSSDAKVFGNAVITGTLTSTGTLAAVAGATVGTTLGVGGATVLESTLKASGATTFGSTVAATGTVTALGAANVNGNATITGTLSCTGIATFVAVPVFNAGLGANGTVVAIPCFTNLPTGSTTNAVWIKVGNGATTYVVPAFAQP
jgi:hypothetical protein